MNIFQRAAAGLNLTPEERATLKLIQGFAQAGVMSLVLALPTALAYQSGNLALAASGVSVALGAFVHGAMGAWAKYVSAKGDAPLATAITSADSAVQAALGQPNAVKTLADDASAAAQPVTQVALPVVQVVKPTA